MSEIFVDALRYASEKHLEQRRKGCDQVPYINHPVKVAHILLHCGITDEEVLAAALLHDVLEDTDATEDALIYLFGKRIAQLVVELTDDMTVTYDDRKRKQILKAPLLTADAKQIKIADKIANIEDILTLPLTWSHRRKRQYYEWSEKVVEGCRGINPRLEQQFDTVLAKAVLAFSAHHEI